jgi:hypothetical protein
MSNTTMTVPLVSSKYFKQETVTLQPGQKYEIGGFKMYYVMYTLVDPPTGLGFIQVSIDNGPFFPISLLPYRDEAGFQYVTLYNKSTYTFTVSLIIAVSREASLLGTWTPSYTQINAELITNVQVNQTTAYYAGPFYLGIRSVVYISITNASLTTSSTTNAAAITVYLYNSDQSGNLYNQFLLGSLVQYPSGAPSGYVNQNSMYVTVDGSLLSNYVMLYFNPNAYTSRYTFNLQIVAR